MQLVDYSSSEDESNQLTPIPSDIPIRTRMVPHIKGNWATSVFIPISPNEKLEQEIHHVIEWLETKKMSFELIEPLHLSLSKTNFLKEFQIDSFVRLIQKSVVEVNAFRMFLGPLSVFVNESETTLFLSLNVMHSDKKTRELLTLIDQIMLSFHLPPFYNDSRFHVSIALDSVYGKQPVFKKTINKACK